MAWAILDKHKITIIFSFEFRFSDYDFLGGKIVRNTSFLLDKKSAYFSFEFRVHDHDFFFCKTIKDNFFLHFLIIIL